jgi:phosphoribosylamine---glycine ligase
MIVGGGARSHALGMALLASPSVGLVEYAPGTSGLERRGFATVPVSSQDFPGLVEHALLGEHDLTVVGPNTPLVDGICDAFAAQELPIFGPDKAAARLEGSKVFARQLMNSLAIETPRFAICDGAKRARDLALSYRWPRVFKADGIAYGKGVRVTHRVEEIDEAINDVLHDNIYGLESDRIVVEERLEGTEVTVFSLTDGRHVEVLGHVHNYPRLLEGERGPPTRGMGQIAPAPYLSGAVIERIQRDVLQLTVDAMNDRGTPICGALFVDLMIVRGGQPVVIDYNVRFGDPATQILLSRLRGDFYACLQACRGQGDLRSAVAALEIDERPRVSVVLASAGYPDKRTRGAKITIDEAFFAGEPDLWLFEDGVRWVPPTVDEAGADVAGWIETTGGRTFTVVAAADSIEDARAKAYAAIPYINFEGMHYRTDIGLGIAEQLSAIP